VEFLTKFFNEDAEFCSQEFTLVSFSESRQKSLSCCSQLRPFH